MVYTETRPRGPIFIDFDGPGPAYNLPGLIGEKSHDPRSNHNRGPAYSMGGRWKERKGMDSAPGPIYHPGENFYKTGRDNGVSVSMKGRYKDRKSDGKGPGPQAYNPDTAWLSSSRNGPSYSMGGRYKARRTVDESPGPNAYVPSFARQEGKGYSLKGRHKERVSEEKTPGPMSYKPGSGYTRYGRRTAPEASLKGRNEALKDKSVAPGPGKYYPQTDNLSSSKALPAWSLSSRHKELTQKDKGPGPNTYLPLRPSETASAPAYSLGGKYKKQKNSADDSPGPGQYHPDPSIGVRGKYDEKAASLKSRHPENTNKDKVPGPQTYNTNESPRESGPAYSITGKPRTLEKVDESPGPNKYFPTLAPEKEGPSLKGRYKESDKTENAPGPGAYNVPELKDIGPAYSMAGKWMDDNLGKKGEHSPGPATYNTGSNKQEEGGVSFGVRHSRAKYEGKMKGHGKT